MSIHPRSAEIISRLPHAKGFRFVDHLLEIDEEKVVGIYRFRESEYFFKHHFPNNPVVPGVILTECMAQIGLGCLGVYLSEPQNDFQNLALLSETDVVFNQAVPPETTVVITAKKIYHRFSKLKCAVQMRDEHGQKIAEGTLAAIIKNSTDER